MRHNVTGTIYLLHFERRYPAGKRPGHYLGWTEREELQKRLDEHRAGHGSVLMAVIKEAGIGFEVARLWYGTRYLERRLKKHGPGRYCLICRKAQEEQREHEHQKNTTQDGDTEAAGGVPTLGYPVVG